MGMTPRVIKPSIKICDGVVLRDLKHGGGLDSNQCTGDKNYQACQTNAVAKDPNSRCTAIAFFTPPEMTSQRLITNSIELLGQLELTAPGSLLRSIHDSKFDAAERQHHSSGSVLCPVTVAGMVSFPQP